MNRGEVLRTVVKFSGLFNALCVCPTGATGGHASAHAARFVKHGDLHASALQAYRAGRARNARANDGGGSKLRLGWRFGHGGVRVKVKLRKVKSGEPAPRPKPSHC